MPAVSKAQQRFFGMVHAGVIPKPKGMKKKDVKKFAKTKHDGLPERKEKDVNEGSAYPGCEKCEEHKKKTGKPYPGCEECGGNKKNKTAKDVSEHRSLTFKEFLLT